MSAAAATTLEEGRPLDGTVQLVLAGALVAILVLMLVPLPAPALDAFLTLNLTLSLLVLMVAIYVRQPLDFDAFPSVLLCGTLFRLSLNVASTRLILSEGDRGADAVGLVVSAFGQFVAGGNPVVGGIVFFILVLINFIVITKGAGRIAEVSARFMLDALPGKQLSIDANLSSGLIDEEEARRRRRALEREAEFHGAMDGASKFVRGDAAAGLAITAINIVGGLIVGVGQRGLSFGEAVEIYTVLTIGDGLVSQIPGLLISTAAGLVVTKASDGASLGQSLGGPLLRHPRAAVVTGGIVLILGLVPGLPLVPFVALAVPLMLAGNVLVRRSTEVEPSAAAAPPPSEETRLEELLVVDPIAVEVGYGLVSLADRARDGNLPQRVRAIRRQLAEQLGLVVPPVHIRDNLALKPDQYRVLLKGIEVARGELRADGFLALDPGGLPPISGKPTKDPAFGLPGIWIGKDGRTRAESLGYTVVDAASTLATHLSVVLRRNAHDIFGLDQLGERLERLSERQPRLVEELIPDPLPRSVLLRVLRNLLQEGVSIRDLETILEALAEVIGSTRSPAELTEHVRQVMSRAIVERHLGDDRSLHVLTLSRDVETRLLREAAAGEGAVVDGPRVRHLVEKIRDGIARAPASAGMPVLLVPAPLRRALRHATSPFLPDLAVLAQTELVPGVMVRSVGSVE